MQTKTFEISGVRYEVYMLTGRRAMRLAYRLSKYLSGPVSELAEGVTTGSLEATQVDLGAALRRFFDGCSEEDFVRFTEEMFDDVRRNNAPLKDTMDVSFQGKPAELFEVLYRVVRIQFEDFFTKLAGSIKDGIGGQLGNKAELEP